MPGEIFPNLQYVDLIRQLPEILELPHVHVDPVMIVIYYGVLYNGSPFNGPEGRKWPQRLYLCALRALPAWERESSGTVADFMAAISMVCSQAIAS